MKKNQHVTKHPDGGWQVKGAGNSKATIRTKTQAEAIEAARKISGNQESQVVVHKATGQIRKNTGAKKVVDDKKVDKKKEEKKPVKKDTKKPVKEKK